MAENRRVGLAKAWEGPEWMLRGPGRRAVTVENSPRHATSPCRGHRGAHRAWVAT